MKTLEEYRNMVEEYLKKAIPETAVPQKTVFESMRYSLLAGGKRLRPVLCLAAAEALGEAPEKVLPIACGIEMIHTFSLIHDDLPSMDNDDYRRGRLTNHKVYGEAMAILSGDALSLYAFKTAAKAEIAPERLINVIKYMAEFSGADGMIGGQVVDIESENTEISAETLRFLHENKTSALITESLLCGAAAAGASNEILEKFKKFGLYLGLAFQVQDDILDVVGNSSELGKATGSDADSGKCTYVTVFGLKRAEKMSKEYTDEANNSLSGVPESEFFINFANGLLNRKN